MNTSASEVRPAEPRAPLFAREGWAHIAIIIGLAMIVTVTAGWVWAAPVWLLAVFVLQFFRDPARVLASDKDAVLCPADGRVIAVGPAKDPYLDRPAIKFSIFMNVFNVHSNRLPIGGVIKHRWYYPGRFFNAALDKASEHNERNALWITTPEGNEVVVVQVAGLIARRILCYVDAGDQVAAGRRYGFIRFGSRVDVYLPTHAYPRVGLGDKVKAGCDILALLQPQA